MWIYFLTQMRYIRLPVPWTFAENLHAEENLITVQRTKKPHMCDIFQNFRNFQIFFRIPFTPKSLFSLPNSWSCLCALASGPPNWTADPDPDPHIGWHLPWWDAHSRTQHIYGKREGSGSRSGAGSVPLTNGSGRPTNMRILRIREAPTLVFAKLQKRLIVQNLDLACALGRGPSNWTADPDSDRHIGWNLMRCSFSNSTHLWEMGRIRIQIRSRIRTSD